MTSAAPIRIAEWGGDGGSPWNFLLAKGGITKITIMSGDVLHSISFEGQDGNGNPVSSPKFGGDHGGSPTEAKLQWPAEYLTTISGTFAEIYESLVITSLEFSTNIGMKYGPFGTANGKAFSLNVNGSASIVGFHGRSGELLDAIGVYIKQTP